MVALGIKFNDLGLLSEVAALGIRTV